MNINQDETYTACWAMWPRHSDRDVPIESSIDQALAGYLFYPEPEWSRFGYRPPENFPLIGAWRDTLGKSFIFLLDSTSKRLSDINSPSQLLLYVVGDKGAVESVEGKIKPLKDLLSKAERKELRGQDATLRLEGERTAKPIERLIKLIGLFTVIINGFSLYLRKLTPPTFPIEVLNHIYNILLSAVHFSALFLLLLIIVIGILYAFRYGLLLLRKM